MIRHRTTRHADGVRRFRLRRFLHRPAVAATRTCEYAGIIGDRCLTPVANPVEPVYDADGNLIEDDRFEYTYDDENRLVSVCPVSPAANDLAVENFYDHLHRRIQKTVYQYVDNDWTPNATHTFVWDGMNIVLERIAYADNTTCTCEYYWDPDRSGTEQGAGGVEGLLAVSIDGTFYFPLYGDNSSIVGYISEAGALAAQYVYDPYGNITETYGPSPDLFAFGFSTKYHSRLVDCLGLSFGMIGPFSGSVVDTYDGSNEVYLSSLWLAVYGEGEFDIRRRLKYHACDCSDAKHVDNRKFDYYSVQRGGMVFVKGYGTPDVKYKVFSYAEVISLMNDVLWAIKGTVDVQIELVKKSSNDVKLFGGPQD